jgi:hypothetical protein
MKAYPGVDIISLIIFAGAVIGLYVWTRRQAGQPLAA